MEDLSLGKKLYKVYVSKRDYSGSPQDEYAQLLSTIYLHLGDSVFTLLKTAEISKKKLELRQSFSDEYTIEDIALISI
jgi:hypothetical protein